MDDWGRLPLGKAFEVQLGKMLGAGSEHGNQYHYLANRNVQWGRIVIDELGTMHFSAAEREQYRLQSGDLLVCEGGEVGRAALWSDELPDCYFQNAIHRLRATGIVDPRFMRHYFEFAAVAGLLRAMTGKTSIGHLPRSKLVSWHVPVPPVEEQRRIAEVLDTIEETIQATERVIGKRRTLRAGLAADLLKPPNVVASSEKSNGTMRSPASTSTSSNWDMNNSGLSSVPLSEIAAFTNGYGFGPKDWGKSGLPIIRIQQLLNTDAVADAFAGSLDTKYRIDTGDLIMSWSGTLAVVRWDRGPAWLNQHLFRVDPKAGVDGAFLRHLLISRLGYLEAESHGTTMRHIKRGDLLRHAVPLPSLGEQRRIAEILDTMDSTIEHNEAELAKLRELRAGLAADLLSGRVRTVAA